MRRHLGAHPRGIESMAPAVSGLGLRDPGCSSRCCKRIGVETAERERAGLARVQDDPVVGTRPAIGLGPRLSQLPVVQFPILSGRRRRRSRTTVARCNLNLYMPARGDAKDDAPTQPQHEELGQENQEEDDAGNAGHDSYPERESTRPGPGMQLRAPGTGAAQGSGPQ
jgi:hypothetical protein